MADSAFAPCHSGSGSAAFQQFPHRKELDHRRIRRGFQGRPAGGGHPLRRHHDSQLAV